MDYKVHLEKIKTMDINEPEKIRAYILSIQNNYIADKLCAKWLVAILSNINYVKEPDAPHQWAEMKDDIECNFGGWRSKWSSKNVQEYVDQKMSVNAKNLSNFFKLKFAAEHIDGEDIKAMKKIHGKIKEFLSGRQREAEKPFVCYEFYGVCSKAERDLQVRIGNIQRRADLN